MMRMALAARHPNVPPPDGASSPVTPKMKAQLSPKRAAATSPAAASPFRERQTCGQATQQELEAADAALREMEAQQARVVAPRTPEDASNESSDEEEEEEEEEIAQPRDKRWSVVTGRRSSCRRDSLQHLRPHQRSAMRRLSDILRDHGASRREEERRASTCRIQLDAHAERERRRLSAKKRRLQSIAGMIDLALVWPWLEHLDLDDDGDDDCDGGPECEKRDQEAARLVHKLVSRHGVLHQLATKELGVTLAPHGPPLDLDAPTIAAKIVDFDLNRGLYTLHVKLHDGRGLKVERSWQDFQRLAKLVTKAAPRNLRLPRLPRPRAMSVARNFVRNVRVPKKGDRLWQQSKTAALDKYLAKLGDALEPPAVAVPLVDVKRFRPLRADEILKDFLFKFGVLLSP